LYYVVVGSVSGGSWSVGGSTRFEGTSAQSNGGGLAYEVGGEVSGGSWSVGGTTSFVGTSAQSSGIFTQGGGGGLYYNVDGDVSGGSWSVGGNTSFVGTSAQDDGGGLYYKVHGSVIGGSWSVDGNTSFVGTSAQGHGGGLYYVVVGSVSGGSWSVGGSTSFVGTSAQEDGGGLAYYVSVSVSGGSWSVRGGTSFANVSAGGSGGSIHCVIAGHASNATFTISNVSVAGSSCDRFGGLLYVSAPFNGSLHIDLRGISASSVAADSGGLLYASLLSKASGIGTVDLMDIDVVDAAATDRGGVVVVEAVEPPISNVGRGFSGPIVPRHTPLRFLAYLLVDRLQARAISAAGGVLFDLTNVVSHLSRVDLEGAHSPIGKALIAAEGYCNITLVESTFANTSGGPLFSSEGQDVNCTMANVQVDLSPFAPSNSTDVIIADRLVVADMVNVSVVCPRGTASHDASRGRSRVTHTITACNRHSSPSCITIPWSFDVFDSYWQCVECPANTYSIARPHIEFQPCPANCTPGGLDIGSLFNRSCCGPVISSSACFLCPFGAICDGGTAVRPEEGFWGTTTPSDRAALISPFVLLPHSYGCRGEECDTYDACGGSRTGLACGSCSPGHSEALGTAACISDQECGFRWQDYLFWPLYLVAVSLVSWALYLLSSRADLQRMGSISPRSTTNALTPGSAVAVLINLYQLSKLGFVRTDTQSRCVLQTLGEVANLRFHAGHHPSAVGVCLAEGLDAPGLQAMQILLAVLNLGVVLAVWAGHVLVWWTLPRVTPPNPRAYMTTFLTIVLVMYSSIGEASINLFAPLVIPSYSTRLAIDANYDWMGTWWQWAALLWFLTSTLPAPLGYLRGFSLLQKHHIGPWHFAAYVLSPLAAEAAMRMRRRMPSSAQRPAVRHLLHMLGDQYREELPWWDGVVLGRRLLFVLASLVFVGNPQRKLLSMGLLSVLYAISHVSIKPYRSWRASMLETVSLAGLCASSMINLHYATVLSDAATGSALEDTGTFVVVEMVALFVPPLLAAWWVLGQGCRRCGRRGEGDIDGKARERVETGNGTPRMVELRNPLISAQCEVGGERA